MAKLAVQVEEREDTYHCTVTVKEGNKSTRHNVKVSREDFERLTGGDTTPEALVRASFEFLLERESKESILRSFDLMTINRYFPEYEREIRQRVK
jgi:ribosome-associated toxin RatA of RatAB toxin-antitoxin module